MKNSNYSNSNNANQYILGVLWFVLSLIVSIINDAFMKYLGGNLHSIEITFFRFLFGTMSLLPVMLYYGKGSFKTSRIGIHFFRGALLFVGIALWCYGLTIVPIAMATTLNFTIPLITLVLAIFFLGEKVGWVRWVATVIGFLGVIIVLEPNGANFNNLSLLILLSAAMFAGLDIMNKKFVVKESMLGMLFYTALLTMAFAAIPTIAVWKTPTIRELSILFCVGCGANFLLYCLLKAFSFVDASALAPFRYVELILSAGLGFLVFSEIPSLSTAIGSLIIVPSTFIVVWLETRRAKIEANQVSVPEPQLQDSE